MHDAGNARPDVIRFLAWYHLERAECALRAAVTEAMAEKVSAIRAAQERGTVTGEISAEGILALALALVNMWQPPGEDIHRLVPTPSRRER
ncbi:hypothetical protein [Streptomyces sp. NPDC001356]